MPDYPMTPSSLAALLAELARDHVTGPARYDAVRRYLTRKARADRTPLSGSFELTPLCNLDCKMCYVHLSREQMGDARLLTLEEWIGIAQQAIDAGMLYAQLTGGECLTYPDFRAFYLFLQSKGIEITLKTNGLLLDGDMLAFLTQHPPAEINVTVYGADDDGYERVTGRRVFQKVMDHLLAVQAAGLPLSVSITPNAYMTDGVRLLHTLKGHGLPWSINGGLMLPAPETGRSLAEAPVEAYAELLRTSRQLLGRPIAPRCGDDELPEPGTAPDVAETISCAAGRSCFAVNWRGYLQPCINLYGVQYDIAALGFAQAWQQLGQRLNELLVPAECGQCAYRGVCYLCIAAHQGRAPAGHACRDICNWSRHMVAEGLLSLE